MPLYQQVAEKIQQDITAGQLKPGHLAPSEAQIVARWGVARITARKAIAVLRERGLVHTVRGKGTFVGPEGTPHNPRATKAASIAAELAEEIRAGQYERDVPLPSETALAQRFDVAKGTIRAAVAILREQGWAYTVPMRGTYATDPSQWPKG